MFTRLTVDQAGIIQTLDRDLNRSGVGRVAFLGIDQNELPVIQFKDRRRTTEPFAIPRSTSRSGYAAPAYPLRWFTEQEADVIDPVAHEILTGLYRSVE